MAEPVTVDVAQGTLRGERGATESGGPLFSFRGVPYARPPVGPLRFKAPQSLASWVGVRDARSEGPMCAQINDALREYEGQEDCLYLNAYTAQFANLQPVMVWIHGGTFLTGSGSRASYGPDYLVDAGVVLVTFNYRLGPLGFLSLQNSDIPGNAGMKDQVAALRWVKQNIRSFGGDPNNVTIFGSSSGGVCVHYLMLSPMAQGLFHRAISQSGSALNPWAFSMSTVARTFQLGEALGCNTDDPKELFEVLKTAEPKAMVEALKEMLAQSKKAGKETVLLMPTLEPQLPRQEAFLSRAPAELISAAAFHHVPYVTGLMSHDGIVNILGLLGKPAVLKVIDGDFQRLVPNDLRPHRDPRQVKDISDKIKRFYFGDQPLSTATQLQYVHLNTDINFTIGMLNTLRHQSALSTAPTYCYQFSFEGALGFMKRLWGAEELPGASHGDEVGYLFRVEGASPALGAQSPAARVRSRMVKMWTHFARTGNPTPVVDKDITVSWTPYTVTNPGYLSIDTELSMRRHIEENRMNFWDQLYRAKL